MGVDRWSTPIGCVSVPKTRRRHNCRGGYPVEPLTILEAELLITVLAEYPDLVVWGAKAITVLLGSRCLDRLRVCF